LPNLWLKKPVFRHAFQFAHLRPFLRGRSYDVLEHPVVAGAQEFPGRRELYFLRRVEPAIRGVAFFHHSGGLKELEDQQTPRAQTWDPLLKSTGAPGIHYQDFSELAGFNCPEWSHLSAGDSVEFTKRLVSHLRTALGM
jgi:hypothetical protein